MLAERRRPVVRRGRARLQARRAAAVQEPPAAGVRRALRRSTSGTARSCTSPTRRCWPRCSAPTCASGRNVAAMDAARGAQGLPGAARRRRQPDGLSGSQMTYTNRMSLGQASLEADHSLKVFIPAGKPLILELVDGNGNALFTMTEEHQVTRRRVHHAGPAPGGVQQHLRRLPRQPDRVRARRRRQRRRADRRVGVDVARPGAEDSAVAAPKAGGAAPGGGGSYVELSAGKPPETRPVDNVLSCCPAATDAASNAPAGRGARSGRRELRSAAAVARGPSCRRRSSPSRRIRRCGTC